MTLRVLVVEDEQIARRYLVELLEATGRAEVGAALETYDEARELLSADCLAFDVAFVDIHLAGDEAGLRLVREFPDQENSPLFVLATAYPEHAVEAFALGVRDYLLKPFDAARVDACLDRLMPLMADRSKVEAPKRVVGRTSGGLVFLELNEVVAFQAEDRLVYVHARGRRFDVDVTLSMFERNFDSEFLRVHRNWLVHREQITGMERTDSGTILTVGDLTVPVSRDRSAEIRRLLLNNTMGIKSRL